MATKSILFKKEKDMVPRETVVREFITACENLDLKRLEALVYDDTNFYDHNQAEFMAVFQAAFDQLKSQGITKVKSDTEFIDLCFFKQEIVIFSASGEAMFSLMFDTDEGFVKDITICAN